MSWKTARLRRRVFSRADVIVSYDGKLAENAGHLRNMVASTLLGKTVTVKVIRDKKPMEMQVEDNRAAKRSYGRRRYGIKRHC